MSHQRNTVALSCARAHVQETLAAHDGRLVITTPPQEALKTSLAVEVAADALGQGRRVFYATYLEALARNVARRIVSAAGDDAAPLLRYSGVGNHLSGVADVLVVDDPTYPVASPADREHAYTWLTTVAVCRLPPGGSVVVLATRHDPDDVPGRLIDDGWPTLNFPAVAAADVPDALNRPVGTYLPSLRGRTADDYDRVRLLVGERTWLTLYQGVPPDAGEHAREVT